MQIIKSLQNVLGSIKNPDQVGYIKGRFIGENIRTIKDMMEYCDHFGKPGLLALVDFEKAFDSISWPFLIKSLKAFNFGDKFVGYVKMLYNDTESCVINNGKASRFFKLHRGIRQGCCLSALLFIIVVELLATDIRSNQNIKGIHISNIEYKISQLADDTTLFIRDGISLTCAFDTLDLFSKCSGLKLNKSKTMVIPLHMYKEDDKSIKRLLKEGPFKTLGIWFSNSNELMYELNLKPKLRNIEQSINIWSSQSLSLKGKITVIKSLIISPVINMCSMIYVPDTFISDIDKLLCSFLWCKKAKSKKRSYQ